MLVSSTGVEQSQEVPRTINRLTFLLEFRHGIIIKWQQEQRRSHGGKTNTAKWETLIECQREARGHSEPLVMRCRQLKGTPPSMVSRWQRVGWVCELSRVGLGVLSPWHHLNDVLMSWHYVMCFPVMLSQPDTAQALPMHTRCVADMLSSLYRRSVCTGSYMCATSVVFFVVVQELSKISWKCEDL